MSWHPHITLWICFFLGMGVYMLKRAYYLVTGPNPVARTYGEFIEKCWIPLLVRFAVDSGVYWLSFYPELFNPLVSRFGFELHSPVPQYAVVAFFIGLGVDSLVDFAVTKIPGVKDWLPQMPPPLAPNGRNGGMTPKPPEGA